MPFDFAHKAIGLQATVGGKRLYVILDTGVDPSVIDLTSAAALGLRVDRSDPGEASGFGDGRGAAVFPATIAGLAIRGHRFKPFAALAYDLSAVSRRYGRKLDAVLGYSFLADKIVLIDYPRQTLAILASAGEARSAARSCRKRWTVPLTTSDGFPIIPDVRIGGVVAPVSLDTGSNGGIAFFPTAANRPDIRAALVEKGTLISSGARGDAAVHSYMLTVPVGIGPFVLPAGQVVTVHGGEDPADGRIANVGNALFDMLGVRMLLDYRGRTITFYRDCR